MPTTTSTPLIPTSASMFQTSGCACQFRDWLHAVRGDLPHARCAEIAERAGEALEVLGAAAPHVIPADPAAALSFLDHVDLPLLGLASDRLGKLKRAVRGLHSWANGFDGPATRRFMDQPSAVDGILPPPAASLPTGAPTGTTRAQGRACGRVPVPDPEVARATEVPPSFAVLETAVAAELARRDTHGELVDIVAAGRAVLHRHRADVRRQIAIRTAEACEIAPTVFVRDGATSTVRCEFFLLRLLIARGVATADQPTAA